MTVAGWNFAEMWEAAADQLPDAPATVQRSRRIRWSAFDERADGMAAWALALGVAEQDTVAQYLHDSPEYLASMFGAYEAPKHVLFVGTVGRTPKGKVDDPRCGSEAIERLPAAPLGGGSDT